VADSISWQRFCRIPLGAAAPHPTTLMKITTRCGASAIDGLNEALLAKATGVKVLKTNNLRADTTVVRANVAYPTDSGLLAKGVAKMAKAVERLKANGLAPRIKTHDRTRLVRAHAWSIGANLRRRTDEEKDEVLAINARTVRIASAAVHEARRAATNARRTLRQLGDAAPPKLEPNSRKYQGRHGLNRLSSHQDYGFLNRRRLIVVPRIGRVITHTLVRGVAVVRTLAPETCSETIIIYTQANK
jgi:IS5 family transposase